MPLKNDKLGCGPKIKFENKKMLGFIIILGPYHKNDRVVALKKEGK